MTSEIQKNRRKIPKGRNGMLKIENEVQKK
jgi:hypothetical protein